MRHHALIIAAALLVAYAAPLHAESKTSFGLHGGIAVPHGPLFDTARGGLAIEASVQHMFRPRMGVGLSATFDDFHATDRVDAAVEPVYGTGSHEVFTNWSYVVYGIAALPVGRATPYLRAGTGVYNPKLQIRTPNGILNDTRQEWGYLAGTGVSYVLTPKVSVGIDGAWHQFHDGSIGRQVSWTNVKLGLTLALPNPGDALQP